MSATNAWGRRAVWAMAAVGTSCVLLMIVGLITPAALTVGRLGIRVRLGVAEVAWCSHNLGWSAGAWRIATPGSTSAVLLTSSSDWLPNVNGAALMTTTASGTTPVTVDLLFVPLGPWAVGSLLIAGLLARLFPGTTPAGFCRQCGYDRGGLPDATVCPECGTPSRTER